MDYNYMNFRDFVKDNRRPEVNHPQIEEPEIYDEFEEEEYQEPVKKPVKVQQRIIEEYDEPEEDFDYDEDDFYEEPVKPVRKVVQKVQPKVVRPQRPIQRPVQRPVAKPTYRPGYAMPESQYRRPLAVTPKQLKETTIEGTANTLTEAIKRKVDTVFYRFGIQGLEKLDEKILDTIEELQYPEPKQTRRPLKEMRRVPAKKVKKYRPLPLEEITPVPEPEPIYDEPEYTSELVDEPLEQEQIVEEPVIEEPVEVEEPVEPVQQVQPKVASPKPAFMRPQKEEKPQKVVESTGDEDEDMIAAALSMDYNDKPEEQKPVVSDEEIWGTVEAILESTPQQTLVHEPQTTSCLIQQPILIEQETQTDVKAEQEETKEEQPAQKIKRKRKVKSTEETQEVAKTDEEK